MPHDLIGSDPDDKVDPLAIQIARLTHGDRVQLWHDLAEARRTNRRLVKSQMHKLSDEVEELVAQLEFVRDEMEAVRSRVRRR